MPAAKFKLFLHGLPPKRNCTNPSAQFLLGDFLARNFERFSPEFRLRWGKRIDSMLGMRTDSAKSCNCPYRQKALNDWTLRLVAAPFYQRPWVILIDFVQLTWAILLRAPSHVNKP